MKNFFLNLGIFLLTLIITIIVIAIFWIIGFLIQYFIWFLCTIWDIFKGSNIVIEWIYSHDLTVHIICSIVSFILVILDFLFPGNSNTHIKTTNIVDSSGHYRQWGESFVDAAGNYIHIP